MDNDLSMNVGNLITSILLRWLYSEDNSFVPKMLVFSCKQSVWEPIENSMTITADSGD